MIDSEGLVRSSLVDIQEKQGNYNTDCCYGNATYRKRQKGQGNLRVFDPNQGKHLCGIDLCFVNFFFSNFWLNLLKKLIK